MQRISIPAGSPPGFSNGFPLIGCSRTLHTCRRDPCQDAPHRPRRLQSLLGQLRLQYGQSLTSTLGHLIGASFPISLFVEVEGEAASPTALSTPRPPQTSPRQCLANQHSAAVAVIFTLRPRGTPYVGLGMRCLTPDRRSRVVFRNAACGEERHNTPCG
ncbi:hypothetical protein CKAH01_13494 [Colletotrichum kahawae]|uniref:Uncharacterized protein n=1 Tax=Colletotrichum kahawae TaxID=34407 RepID=A0AAD9YRK0_COLKA|nr:hypothetical protein CKAH01_13494 [Colletotrichum kahawae]